MDPRDRPVGMSRSVFRFLPSNQSGQYSVWRDDKHLGHVTKNVYRIHDRGVTRTTVSWTPSTPNRADLATEKTRDAAAKVLWTFHQASGK